MQVTSEEGFYRATLQAGAAAQPSLRRKSSRPSRRVNGLFEQYVKLSQSLNYDTMIAAARVDDPAKLSDTIAANLQIPVEEKQELLENFDRAGPPEPRRRDPGKRNRKAQRRPQHQFPREAADGARAERVLPQRKAQGHSQGTGPRRKERTRRAEEKDRNRRHAQGRPGKGHAGTEAAGNDAADVRRIHRQPQLSGLAARRALEEEVQRNSRYRRSPKKSSKKIITAWKRSKNASWNTWPCANW